MFVKMLICSCICLFGLNSCSTTAQYDTPAGIGSSPKSLSPEDKQAQAYSLLMRGVLLLQEDDLDAAEEALKKALALDPEAAFLYYYLALIQTRKGELDAAVAVAEKALLNDSGNVEVHELLGEIFLSTEKPEQAATHLRHVVAAEPDNEEARLRLGVAYVQAGEMDRAMKTFEAMLDQNPTSPAAMLALGRLYRQAGLLSLAEELYRKILLRQADFVPAFLELGEVYEKMGEPENALDIYRQGLEIGSERALIRFRIARLLIEENRLDEALEEYRIVLAQDPGNVEALQTSGLLYLNKQDWQEGEKAFKRLLESRPDLGQARYYLGIALEKQGKTEEALQVFMAAEPGGTEYPDMLIHAGYLFHELDRVDEGLAFLEVRLDSHVATSEVYRLLAILYAADEEDSKALRTLAEGLEKFPDDTDLLYQKGMTLEKRGRRDEAIDIMYDIIRIDSDHSDAINYIAYTYAERGVHLEKALKMARKALALNDSAHIHDTLGWVYYKLGAYPEALRYVQMAVAAMPEDPVVLEHLGDIYAAMGESARARAVYEKILEIKPQDKGIARKLRRLP